MGMSGYAKAIAAAIGAGLTAAITYYPHAAWIPIATAICTALATYHIGNEPQKSTQASTVQTQDNIPAQEGAMVSPDTLTIGPDDSTKVSLTFSERTQT